MLVTEELLASAHKCIYELQLLIAMVTVFGTNSLVLYYLALFNRIYNLRDYFPLPQCLRHLSLAHFYRSVAWLVFINRFFTRRHKCLGVKIFIYIDVYLLKFDLLRMKLYVLKYNDDLLHTDRLVSDTIVWSLCQINTVANDAQELIKTPRN